MISVIDFKNKIINKEKIILFDVREEWEFQESTIEKAINIPLYTIPNRINDLGSKQDEIILFCRTGNRGNIAINLLVEAGYSNVKNLEGGKVAFEER